MGCQLSGPWWRSMPSTSAPRRAMESARMPPPQPMSSTFLPGSGPGLDPVQTQRVDHVQGTEFAVHVPPTVGQFRKLGQFGRIGVDGSVIHAAIIPWRTGQGWHAPVSTMRKTRRGGFPGSAPRNQFLRVPTTSISTRRFLARPSLVLLSATGCFSPCLRCRHGSSRCPWTPGRP